ncbi:DUF2577 domain-containing protein [Paenibacillus amylolyticus]|uniref:DUF2577 domain-containing protein n=1 Tax=Paenibacillus amylolyticus TaxID=1451 RepID=UPI0031831932
MAMIDLIKEIAIASVNAGDPTAIMYGSVIADSPLEINIDQRFTLDVDLLEVPESLTHYEINLHHNHKYTDDGSEGTTGFALPEEPIVIRRGLEVGDRVILVRVQGGQKYVVLDRLVD